MYSNMISSLLEHGQVKTTERKGKDLRRLAERTITRATSLGDILLKLEGWRQVERVLQAIDAIERLGIDPAAVSPDHWRHVHNRMTAGQEPRAYTPDQHRAYLLRRKVEP